jgi:hypothetical protein
MATALEPVLPNITRWVNDHGIVEVGYDPNTDSFARAIDQGGGVWTGKPEYKSLDDALMDLEEGIRAALKSRKTRKRKVPNISIPRKKLDHRKTKPSEPGVPKQVRKLDAIIGAIREKERVLVTRLTVVKKLCEDTDAVTDFALFIARKAQGRLRDKKVKERYRYLANQAVKEMTSYRNTPTEAGKWRLLDLLHEIKEEQNEYEPISWGVVRNIDCWDLLVVEKALQGFMRPEEAKYWLYHAARDHVGSSEDLTVRSIPRIEELARFWRRYFKGKARQG